MILQLSKILKLLVGFPLYVLINNVVINIFTFPLFNYYKFYFYGIACVAGLNYKGITIVSIFIVFKILMLFLYYKKYRFLFYYLIFDVLSSIILLLDYLFGTLLYGYFYSNRPIINLSNYLFGNNVLIILFSVIVLFVMLKKENLLSRTNNNV